MTESATHINPLGTDGFEFVEFSAPTDQGIEALKNLFGLLGFCAIAKHKTKDVTLFRRKGCRVRKERNKMKCKIEAAEKTKKYTSQKRSFSAKFKNRGMFA